VWIKFAPLPPFFIRTAVPFVLFPLFLVRPDPPQPYPKHLAALLWFGSYRAGSPTFWVMVCVFTIWSLPYMPLLLSTWITASPRTLRKCGLFFLRLWNKVIYSPHYTHAINASTQLQTSKAILAFPEMNFLKDFITYLPLFFFCV